MRRLLQAVLVTVTMVWAAACGESRADPLGEEMIFDAERPAAFEALVTRDLTTVSRETTWSSGGGASLRIEYDAWSPGQERWPAVILSRASGTLPVSDFSAFRYLCFEIWNPGRAPVSAKLHLRDGAGKRFSRTLSLDAGEQRQVRLPISALSVDTGNVAEIHVYCTEPSVPFAVCVDSLRLSAGLAMDLAALQEELAAIAARIREMTRGRAVAAYPEALQERLSQPGALERRIDALAKALAGAETDDGRERRHMLQQFRDELDRLEQDLTAVAGIVPLLRAAAQARDMGVAGFALATESSMVKVPLTAGLYDARFGDAIVLEGARNEHEHAQVVVVPFAGDLETVNWRVEDAAGPGGATVPLRVRLVGYVDCEQPSYAVARTGWWADPLVPAQTSVARVPLGELLTLWVSVDMPGHAAAGVYRGCVIVSAAGLPDQEMPVTVRVWDFSLPEHTSLRTALSWRSLSATLYPESRIPQLTATYENWMQEEYHLNAGTIYGGPPTWSSDRLRELRGMGLNAINLAYVNAPRGDAFDATAHWRRFEQLVDRIKAYMPTVEAAGVRDLCYIYCFDERPTDQLDVVFETAARLKSIWPDVEVMTTAYDDRFGMDRENGDAIDIWVPLTPKFDTNAAQIEAARAAGRDIWWYICIGPKNPYANWFVEYTAIEPRLIMGAMTAKYRPGGFLYYAVNRWPLNDQVITGGPRTAWNPASFKNNNGDGSIMCAGPDGPLATIRLENIRDGIEDFEYYLMLRRLLARRESDGAVRRTVRGLGRVFGMGVPSTAGEVSEDVVRSLSDFSLDPAILQAERRRVARAILRLQ